MIVAWWALPLTAASIALGDFVNRRLKGWLPDDRPRAGRKQHRRPIPLAGVLLVPGIAPWCIAGSAWLELAAIVLVAAIGFVDDRDKERAGPLDDAGVDWRIKAVGLFVAAALIATAAHDPLAAPGAWTVAFGLTFVLANALNFLDNTDGVTAGIGAAILLGTVLLPGAPPMPPWLLAAGCAALAFVPWNWPHSRLFLGDAGAYTIGIAVAAAVVPRALSTPTTLLAVAVPLIDFVQVVLARLVIGVPPWVGDRRHLTHIVQNLGLPRRAVAPLFAGVAFLTVLLAHRLDAPAPR